MQDGSWNQPLPIALLRKETAAAGGTSEGGVAVFSEASSDGDLYSDSVTEPECGEGDIVDLTAFLSADEINLSLDLAREAFHDSGEPQVPPLSSPTKKEQAPPLLPSPADPATPQTAGNLASPTLHRQTKAPRPDDDAAAQTPPSQKALPGEATPPVEKAVHHKAVQPVYKQDKPRLLHEGLELNERASSATEFCSRAATFIEELSSIFKGSAHLEQQLEEDSSSPDSGYLSPRSQRQVPPGSLSGSGPSLAPGRRDEMQLEAGGRPEVAACGVLSIPRFLQKLKSQEVAEGSPIRLECRVRGNPQPLVR
ncbi:unnamed protein product [Ophioblennius macclurei]